MQMDIYIATNDWMSKVHSEQMSYCQSKDSRRKAVHWRAMWKAQKYSCPSKIRNSRIFLFLKICIGVQLIYSVVFFCAAQQTESAICIRISWRTKWQRTLVFLPGKSHGQSSLVGYSPWGRKELDMTEQLHFTPLAQCIKTNK